MDYLVTMSYPREIPTETITAKETFKSMESVIQAFKNHQVISPERAKEFIGEVRKLSAKEEEKKINKERMGTLNLIYKTCSQVLECLNDAAKLKKEILNQKKDVDPVESTLLTDKEKEEIIQNLNEVMKILEGDEGSSQSYK